jgi:hypothetical protein
MSMPARRPDPSAQPSLSLWSAGEEPTDSTLAAAADQPAGTAAPAAGGSAVAPAATAAPQVDLSAAANDSAAVAVLAAPPRPVAAPPRHGRGGLRLGVGGRSAAGLGGDTRNGNGSSARGPLALARAGLRALEGLARVDADRPLSPADRVALAGWPGWGPMAKAFDPYEQAPGWRQVGERLRELLSPEAGTAAQQATPTSFYTSPAVTGAVWRILEGLGFDGGQVLEPGCGSGLFIAAAPPGLPLRWTGVERDPTSAQIAALLHPGARIVTVPLERVSLPPCGFDAAVGNVPFADVTPYDPTSPKLSLHNYFIWRAVQAVRPGGLVAVVTSRYTLDAEGSEARELLVEDADLVGAIRLPTGAFRDFGTEVVCDLLVLRRRASRCGEDDPAPGWLASERRPELRTAINHYWRERPGQVLGRMEPSGGAYHGHTLKVAFDSEPAVLQATLTAAAERLIAAGAAQRLTYSPPPDPTAIPAGVVLADRAGRKDGSFHLVNGVAHQVVGGQLAPVARAGAELTALIGLRDAALALLDAEADPDTTDQVLAPLRDRLNRRYDRYVAAYGPLNRCTLIEGRADEDTGLPTWIRRRPAMGGFRDDPDYVTVLALEVYDDDTGTATKAPILHQRVNRRAQRPQRARDATDAVALCLDERGHLDPATIARLLAIDEADVPEALGGLAHHDPDAQAWVTADDYLSGDVRRKLDAARAAATADPARYARNVAALEAVQPADLGPGEIRVKLGAPWVEAADIQAFLVELLGGQVTVRHEPLTATWEVKVGGWQASSSAATAEWGTSRISAYELVQLACNGGAPVVYDEVERPDGSTARSATCRRRCWPRPSSRPSTSGSASGCGRTPSAPTGWWRSTTAATTPPCCAASTAAT